MGHSRPGSARAASAPLLAANLALAACNRENRNLDAPPAESGPAVTVSQLYPGPVAAPTPTDPRGLARHDHAPGRPQRRRTERTGGLPKGARPTAWRPPPGEPSPRNAALVAWPALALGFSATAAQAHEAAPLPGYPGPEPWIMLPLMAAATAYGIGFARLRARAGHGRSALDRRSALFAFSLAVQRIARRLHGRLAKPLVRPLRGPGPGGLRTLARGGSATGRRADVGSGWAIPRGRRPGAAGAAAAQRPHGASRRWLGPDPPWPWPARCCWRRSAWGSPPIRRSPNAASPCARRR